MRRFTHHIIGRHIIDRVIYIALCLLGLAALAGQPSVAAETVTPAAVVEELHGALLANMKDGAKIGFDARKARLDPVVHKVFDLGVMTRIAVGAGWRGLDDAAKKNLTEVFSDWTVATYAAQFKDWDGEQFVIDGASDPAKADVLVNAEIKPKSGSATLLNYRLRKSTGGTWQVVDIYLDGAVSQLAMRRSEFAGVFAKGGADALIEHMRALTEKLAAEG